MIQKKRYIQPQSRLFALCAECQMADVSKTDGGNNPPESGGDGNGSDMNAKQNSWFVWDDEPTTHE